MSTEGWPGHMRHCGCSQAVWRCCSGQPAALTRPGQCPGGVDHLVSEQRGSDGERDSQPENRGAVSNSRRSLLPLSRLRPRSCRRCRPLATATAKDATDHAASSGDTHDVLGACPVDTSAPKPRQRGCWQGSARRRPGLPFARGYLRRDACTWCMANINLANDFGGWERNSNRTEARSLCCQHKDGTGPQGFAQHGNMRWPRSGWPVYFLF